MVETDLVVEPQLGAALPNLEVGLYYRRYTKAQRGEEAPKQQKLVLGGPDETARDRDASY